jgi:flagellar basal-body rod protein FlgB
LEQALSRTAARQSLLANNLSNVNTPGYKRVDLVFNSQLSSASARLAGGAALVRTAPAHIAGRAASTDSGAGRVVKTDGTTMREDGNNVDIDAEMALLAENSLYYQALVRDLNNRLATLRLAITEGRR